MRDEARGDAELVLAARKGERDAFGILVERWFDRCWEVAWRILHDHGLAADVAQDALFTAWRQLERLDQPDSFGGWLLRISRNRAIDRLERERRTMSTGDDELLDSVASARSPAGSTPPAFGGPDDEVVRVGQQELVWAAAAALGERDASLLDLHLRHGLEPSELADELGITPNAAHQALFRLRNRLGDAVKGWLLWRGGEPTCVVLQAEVAAAGLSSFDARLVRLISNHAEACVACSEERARVTAPAALFGAVPLVLAPTLARAQVLEALRAAGVPVPDAPLTSGGPGADPPEGPAGRDAEPPSGSGVSGGVGDGTAGAGVPRSDGSGVAASFDRHAPAVWIFSPERPKSVWRRTRIPTVVVVLVLLIGGFVRWGPAPPELLAPVADAGTGETMDLPTVEAAPPDDEAALPGTGAPFTPLDLEDAKVIDGTVPDLFPAPFVPGSDDANGPADGPNGGTPQVAPPAEPPTVEEPEEEPGEEAGTERGDGEEAGDEEPGEEPTDPEDPVVDPPTIVRFDLTDLGEACRLGAVPRHRYWRVEWATEDATSVHLDLGDGEGPRMVDPTGMERRVCLPLGATVELSATNEGGTVSESQAAG